MPRNQSRASQRARRLQKTTGGKYTPLLRKANSPRFASKEPAHAEPARRLAACLRADLGAEGEKAARLVDDALAWAVKARELTWQTLLLREAPDIDAVALTPAAPRSVRAPHRRGLGA